MTTKIIVRGNTIRWETTFYDIDDAVANPTVATLYIRFPLIANDDGFDEVTFFMEQDGDTWSATWESSTADRGVVEWSIDGVGSVFRTREDGKIRLTANDANPEPE